MAHSELALRRARRAYERSHLLSGLRGLALAGGLALAAIALHRTTPATWLVAGVLGATLATFGWRGGPWRRGGLAGMIAGVPVFVTPALYFVVTHGGHCASCALAPTLPCLLVCFGTSALVGVLVGHHALRDASSRRYAVAALATASLAGLVGCGTLGFGGAVGVAIGLFAGGLTGWFVGNREAHAQA